MDFITQYLLANSGTEVPIRYTRWAAIALLSATIGRRAYVDHGHFRIYPWLYYCFVGTSGSGKTTAKDQAKLMFIDCFPEFPIGSNIASREQLVEFMSSDQCSQFYNDETGALIEWKPYANFVNELSNFVSFNPMSMVEFLTDIFDSNEYKSSTVKRGVEYINKPYVFLLACTTPDYIIRTFKSTVLGAGFSRRLIFVYDLKEVETIITFPEKSIEAYAAEKWCKEHLISIAKKNTTAFTWAPGAKDFLHDWNVKRLRPKDPVLAGYIKSKDLIVQKIAMCLAYAVPGLQPIFTEHLLRLAIQTLEDNEDNLHRLTVAAGRNQLAVPQNTLLQLLEQAGGMMTEKAFHIVASRDLNEMEYHNMKLLLQKTDQIVLGTAGGTLMVISKAKHDALVEEDRKRNQQPPPTSS